VRFSIVIPTYERREIVTRSVAALDRQSFRDFEAIVVDDGSSDGTSETLRELNLTFPLAVIECPNGGAAVARNIGARAARGDYLIFLDDDMEAGPELLAEHERSLRGGAEMVLGHMPLHPDSPDNLLSQGVGRWAEKRRKRLESIAGEVPVTELNTGQMSVSRAVFERLGGFDSSFTREGLYGGEDQDFGYRVGREGLRVVFNPAAVSRQFYAVDPAAYTRRTEEAGRAARQLQAKHPELTQDLGAGREFTTRRSRIVFGLLGRLPKGLSWPLRALAAHRVRTGKLDFHTYRLFFGLQTMEFQRGYRRGGRAGGGRAVGGGRVVVLAYHAVADLAGEGVLSEYGVPPERFAAQLDGLRRAGWSFVDLDRVRAGLSGDGELPKRAILLTFDDGYADLLSEGAPLLTSRGVPAVAFAITERIGGNNDWDGPRRANPLPLLDEEGLRSLAGAGVTIGSHGATHRRLTELDPAELEAEVAGSKAHLRSIGLAEPVAFSYPYGVWSPEVAAAVKDAGYELAFTVRPGAANAAESPYALPRVEVFAADSPRAIRVKARTAAWPAWLRRRLLRLLGTKP
jgi:glycosyltransferase involved in cell wall biosynthesis/peptidoglycan/xylan/chitin deacetylase (PgdA/CDA1 family)